MTERRGGDVYTVLGWTWIGLHIAAEEGNDGELEPVEGYKIWADVVSQRLGVPERDFKSPAYIAFKDALKDLEVLGAFRRIGGENERKVARVKFVKTDKGQEWWDRVGEEANGPDRPQDARSGVAVPPPMKKWIDASTLNGPSRRLLQQKIYSGEWQIAVRPNEK